MRTLENINSKLLRNARNIAVVGLSPDENRDSNIVACYLEKQGYNVVPVNPIYEEILGKKAYNSLKDIGEEVQVELVNVFRPAEEVPQIVKDALDLNVSGIWLQEGIISAEGKAIAEEHGIILIMDTCIKKVHGALF